MRFTDAVRELSGAQKSSVGAPAYSRFVNRRIGRYLAAFAFLRGMTPNQVTIISAVFTYAGIVVVALLRPSWPQAVLVSLALVIGYALDSADGQLARLRGGGSPAGEFLDHIIDSVKNTAIHLAVLVSFYRFFDLRHEAYLLLPCAYVVVSATFFFGVVLVEQLRRGRRVGARAQAEATGHAPLLRSLIVLPWDYGLLCLVFLTLGAKVVFLPVYAAMLVLNAAFLGVALTRWYRELVALSAQPALQLADR
jgi:phosphatidylglycerophosphate synthase